jgi:hypothetical protein
VTFEIFPKAVKKSSTGDSVVEPDICKQDSFQELYDRISITQNNTSRRHDILLYNTVDAWIEPMSSIW